MHTYDAHMTYVLPCAHLSRKLTASRVSRCVSPSYSAGRCASSNPVMRTQFAGRKQCRKAKKPAATATASSTGVTTSAMGTRASPRRRSSASVSAHRSSACTGTRTTQRSAESNTEPAPGRQSRRFVNGKPWKDSNPCRCGWWQKSSRRWQLRPRCHFPVGREGGGHACLGWRYGDVCQSRARMGVT